MRIAIYSRKSKTTDKGDSIENQIHMCQEYALTHFDSPKFFIFKDEGFSGGNTNRPQFQILLNELKQGSYDVLMCYRLDRISRNVSDFASTLDMLNKNSIGFVSIKENFDTTTPMGRAMIHISSVFAQLERETIAERIKDNLFELSKTGRWLGGTSPLGYRNVKVNDTSNADKSKKYSILEYDSNYAPIVQVIYQKYLELGSISQVETYLMQQGIKTLNNKYFRANVLSGILSNPVYCSATEDAISYFKHLGCIIPDSSLPPSHNRGIMPYNRHKNGRANQKNDYTEWVIAIGTHQPIIDASTWISVQKQLKQNAALSIPTKSLSPALLTGIIYCANCGAPMRVTNQSILTDGSISYIYRCDQKLKSRGKLCNITNAKGHILDNIIIERIKDMLDNESDLVDNLLSQKNKIAYQSDEYLNEVSSIQNEIASNEMAIKKLIQKLAIFDDPDMEKYIEDEVKSYHLKNSSLKEKLKKIDDSINHIELSDINIDLVIKSLKNFTTNVENATIHERRELIRNIIKRIEWDGNNVEISFYLAHPV